MKTLLVSLMTAFLGISSLAHAHETTQDLARCEKIVNTISTTRDLEGMHDCIEFYWHNGGHDIGYNKIIKLGYRIIQISEERPVMGKEAEVYTMVAWLLWSKHVTWRTDPLNMPDGEFKADEAIQLLLRGRKIHGRDTAYNMDCGNTIWGLARHHRPEFYAFVIESFALAEKAINATLKDRIRARLNLAHVSRQRGQKEEAIALYKRVLLLDPDQAVALKYLEQLEATDSIQ